MKNTDDLYSFVYRGVLTEEALDRTGRRRKSHFGTDEARELQKSLSFDLLEAALLTEGQRMSIVYAALHSFENAVRATVTKAMSETHGVTWWEKVPDRIQRLSKTRGGRRRQVSNSWSWGNDGSQLL